MKYGVKSSIKDSPKFNQSEEFIQRKPVCWWYTSWRAPL